jgi:probable HAF family extracellular repeat protein
MRYFGAIVTAFVVIGCREAVQPVDPPLAAVQAASPAAGDYEVIDLGELPYPSGPAGEALDVNERGQVVGWSGGAGVYAGRQTHAFLWDNGVMTDLTPDRGSSRAVFINNSGQVVVRSGFSAFLWERGVLQGLGDLGGGVGWPNGLSAAGAVVGYSTTASGATHAFLWRDGVLQDLGTLGGDYSAAFAINNSGQVVGESRTAAGETHAFLWDASGLRDLGTLGGTFSTARAISDAGVVTGQSADATGAVHAFLWQNGAMQDLGTLGGDYETSIGLFVNSAGQVVGEASGRFGLVRGVFWDKDGMHDLGLLDFGPGSRPSTLVTGMNARGQVTGYGRWFRGDVRPFIWEDGALLELPALPGRSGSRGIALNAHGDVVGWTSTSDASVETHRPALWRRLSSK